MFTLEVAGSPKHGDCAAPALGQAPRPRLIVIDGGPARCTTILDSVRGSTTIRKRREEGSQLEIRMLMVSHIDDDHINGVLRFVPRAA